MLRNKITKRRFLQFFALALLVAAGMVAWSVIRTIGEIPEAYAAWDTGTLLTTYLDQNDGKWPSGWDDLATVINEHEPMLFSRSDEHGERMSDADYIAKLRSMVDVDWTYQPGPDNAASPVTRADGGVFRTVWTGAEPNEMVRSFIAHQSKPQNGG
ncbi:hypothetical protein LF1_52630 [Rubripirellula obstinata]|uniref:Uncharacterized protein n=1 Tax=Rubripirellula obstinata TaxID=406547 RepID=A0A5B1CDH3_9BACT|nr:hypothetical protein [Rubripirellula obstinata]KAA1257414.1 hypothetical protein LF1_52630 [Rubripirellula obstinata]